MHTSMRISCLLVLASFTGLAQGQSAPAAKGGHALPFTLTSSAFAAGAMIPDQYTCSGQDISPALQWSNAPTKTTSFALIMDDPDAPAGDWVHWVMWDVPASKHALAENVAKSEQLDDGSHQGRSSFNRVGYSGPCPPPGPTHRYFLRLYALDSKLTVASGADRAALESAMKGHVLATAEFMGTFHR
jgi:Raf kinase inhibitor-like YbhB/YbcL family protein